MAVLLHLPVDQPMPAPSSDVEFLEDILHHWGHAPGGHACLFELAHALQICRDLPVALCCPMGALIRSILLGLRRIGLLLAGRPTVGLDACGALHKVLSALGTLTQAAFASLV